MSDGGSSGLSGTFELIGQTAKQGTQALTQGVGGLAGSAVKQVVGTGGVAGAQSVDLFAPDVKKPTSSPQQLFGNTQPLTQAGRDALTQERVYTPDELEKIQAIEAELKTMHAQNNNLEAEMESARRKREEEYQDRLQEQAKPPEVLQMGDMEQAQPQQNIAKFQAERGTELAKGNQG